MRQRGWLELGFQESFLMKLFVSQGLVWSKYLCDASRLATVYVLQKRPKMISLAHHRLTNEGLDGWHIAEPSGRWTKGLARLTVDASFGGNIRVAPANYHPAAQRVELRCAEQLLRWLN